MKRFGFCFVILILLASPTFGQGEKTTPEIPAQVTELSKQYNVDAAKFIELQKGGWSEQDLKAGLELAKGYYRSLKVVSNVKSKLLDWDSVKRCFDISRQYHISPEDVMKLRGEKIPFGWEDINNALSRFTQFNIPEKHLLELKKTMPWDEIDRLLTTDRDWGSVTLEKLTELRVKMNWDDINQALNLSKAYGKSLDTILMAKETRNWEEVNKLVDTERNWQVDLGKLMGLRSYFSWDDINNVLSISKDYGRDLDEIIGLRKMYGWDNIRSALDRARQWRVPVEDILKMREDMAWEDIDRALSLSNQYNVKLEDVLGMRKGFSWDEVTKKLDQRGIDP